MIIDYQLLKGLGASTKRRNRNIVFFGKYIDIFYSVLLYQGSDPLRSSKLSLLKDSGSDYDPNKLKYSDIATHKILSQNITFTAKPVYVLDNAVITAQPNLELTFALNHIHHLGKDSGSDYDPSKLKYSDIATHKILSQNITFTAKSVYVLDNAVITAQPNLELTFALNHIHHLGKDSGSDYEPSKLKYSDIATHKILSQNITFTAKPVYVLDNVVITAQPNLELTFALNHINHLDEVADIPITKEETFLEYGKNDISPSPIATNDFHPTCSDSSSSNDSSNDENIEEQQQNSEENAEENVADNVVIGSNSKAVAYYYNFEAKYKFTIARFNIGKEESFSSIPLVSFNFICPNITYKNAQIRDNNQALVVYYDIMTHYGFTSIFNQYQTLRSSYIDKTMDVQSIPNQIFAFINEAVFVKNQKKPKFAPIIHNGDYPDSGPDGGKIAANKLKSNLLFKPRPSSTDNLYGILIFLSAVAQLYQSRIEQLSADQLPDTIPQAAEEEDESEINFGQYTNPPSTIIEDESAPSKEEVARSEEPSLLPTTTAIVQSPEVSINELTELLFSLKKNHDELSYKLKDLCLKAQRIKKEYEIASNQIEEMQEILYELKEIKENQAQLKLLVEMSKKACYYKKVERQIEKIEIAQKFLINEDEITRLENKKARNLELISELELIQSEIREILEQSDESEVEHQVVTLFNNNMLQEIFQRAQALLGRFDISYNVNEHSTLIDIVRSFEDMLDQVIVQQRGFTQQWNLSIRDLMRENNHMVIDDQYIVMDLSGLRARWYELIIERNSLRNENAHLLVFPDIQEEISRLTTSTTRLLERLGLEDVSQVTSRIEFYESEIANANDQQTYRLEHLASIDSEIHNNNLSEYSDAIIIVQEAIEGRRQEQQHPEPLISTQSGVVSISDQIIEIPLPAFSISKFILGACSALD